MGFLDVGAGGAAGLETLLARQLAEEKFSEQKRATQATESYRGDALRESSALRRTTQEGIDRDRTERNQDRDDAKTLRTVAFRPVGSQVTQQEYDRETKAGTPQGVYKVNLETEPSTSYEPGGKVKQHEAAPANITYNGTQSQQDAEHRIHDAEQRALQANEDRDAARGIAHHREDRLTEWGPPVVTVNDPNSGTGTRVKPRNEMAAGGDEGPATGAQRQQNSDAAVALETANRMQQHRTKSMTGPIEGRWQGIKQTGMVPFMEPTAEESMYRADSSQLKNMVIRAITGAQMSQGEAERIMAQIPLDNDDDTVWESKMTETIKNLNDIQSKTGKGPGGGTGGGAGTSNSGAGAAGGGGRSSNIKSITVEKP